MKDLTTTVKTIKGSAGKQGDLWSSHPRDWAEIQEPMGTPLFQAVFETARVGRGTRFLDAGCGAGTAVALAASRGAEASGIDAAPGLIDIARIRAPDSDLRVGDIEALPYLDASFHVTLACNSLQYAADPKAALGELARVTKPGGVVAIGMWGAPERQDFFAIMKAIKGLLPQAPPPTFDLAAPGALEGAVAEAGLRLRATGEVDVPFVYLDEETLWRSQRGAGPIAGAARTVGEAKTREALVHAAAPFRDAKAGSYHFHNTYRYVVAETARTAR